MVILLIVVSRHVKGCLDHQIIVMLNFRSELIVALDALVGLHHLVGALAWRVAEGHVRSLPADVFLDGQVMQYAFHVFVIARVMRVGLGVVGRDALGDVVAVVVDLRPDECQFRGDVEAVGEVLRALPDAFGMKGIVVGRLDHFLPFVP